MCNTLTDVDQIDICNTVVANATLSLQFEKVILDATISLAQCVGVSEYSNLSAISQPISTNVRPGRNQPAKRLHYINCHGINNANRECINKRSNNNGKGRNLLQLRTCASTSQCFQTCPSCQRYSIGCTPSGRVVANAACGTVGLGVSLYVRYIVTTGLCVAGGAICGPADPACAGVCIAALSGLSVLATATPCALSSISLCDRIQSACDTCNIQNGPKNLFLGPCDPNSTQCCAGKTGTACGRNCCCCPVCQAPSGPNCACAAAPC